jgi:4-amino-4-deoxy-L-arabinose transferase-like glycosyltransferase
VRAAFWIAGSLVGAVLCYTTRYYINGDAIAYVEMGEALRKGVWWGLANLTYSPGYPVLLALAQTILDTNPLNELQLLRTVNFLCLLAAMAACDFFMRLVNREMGRVTRGEVAPLPEVALSAVGYSAFLVAALIWVRVRLIGPDMLMLFFSVAAAAIILWIREEPERFSRYIVLGIAAGAGYLTKAFFFPFSAVLLGVAGLVAGSWKRVIPRLLVGVLAMLLVASPLIAALSYRVNRFSYGEIGGLAYALWIAGEGEPIYKPDLLSEKPEVKLYRYSIPCTQPSGHDICYWYIGFRPKADWGAQGKVFVSNILKIPSQTPWLVLVLAWFGLLWMVGRFEIGRLIPASVPVALAALAAAGAGAFCLLNMEPRYLAPFFFIGLVGLAAGLRIDPANARAVGVAWAASALLVLFFVGLLGHTLIDQSLSGLRTAGGKPSYRDAFLAEVSVSDYLSRSGLKRGDEVATLGRRPPIYWARMAGVTVAGEVSEPTEFVNGTQAERRRAADAMSAAGLKAVLAKGQAVGRLQSEGWIVVPGASDYYVLLLNEPSAR